MGYCKMQILEFCHEIPDVLFVSYYCNNNAFYMTIYLRHCIQMNSKYINTYETQPWSGEFG